MRSARLRRPAVAFTALAATLALTACGGDDDSPSADGSAEIRYAWWGAGERNERTQAVIDLFEEANPDVQVSGEPAEFGAHWERLTVQGAAQGAPCLPQQQTRYLADYSTRNQLIDLAPFIDDGTIDVSGIPEVVLGAGEVDGVQYMVPTGIFYYVGLYNQTLVAELGLTEPTADWTWDEWEAWLRGAAEVLPDDMHAVDLFVGTDFTGVFQNYVVSNGEALFGDGELGFEPQTLADWFTLWKSLVEDGVSTDAVQLGERGLTIDENPLALGQIIWTGIPDNQIIQMNAATEATGTGVISMNKLPNGSAGAGEVLGANGLAISTSCEGDAAIQASADFIDFFVNDEGAAEAYLSNNGTTTVTTQQDAQRDAPDTNPYVAQAIDLLQTVIDEYSPSTVVTPVGGREVTDAFTRIATSVWLGEVTPEQGAQQFVDEANGVLGSAG